MFKKTIIPIIGIFIITISIIGWQSRSYSQGNIPYPNIDQAQSGDDPPLCTQAWANEMHLMQSAWHANLEAMRDQEKPTSEMVDEAFDSLRTYRCWLNYLCYTVQYSGIADFENIGERKLTEAEIGQIPGCMPPEDIEISTTSIKLLPQCKVMTNQYKFKPAMTNYERCQNIVNLHTDFIALVTLEKTLKTNYAQQKARALEDKLVNILSQMHSMEVSAQYLKTLFYKLDQKFGDCYLEKCD